MKALKTIILILLILCILLTIPYFVYFRKLIILKKVSDIAFYSEVVFQEVPVNSINNDYKLDLNTDSGEYFTENLIDGKTIQNILLTVNMLFNKQVAAALSELYADIYETDNYTLLVRRGYLDCSMSDPNCVLDHKSGYDIDFQLENQSMTDFEGYPAGDWLIENAYKYGFILRYNTKDDYQPWHYRYVGKTHAYAIKKQKQTIEAYLESMKENTVYEIEELNQVLYKIKASEKIKVPQDKNYEISSIGNNFYVINFAK